jgi:wyosine [tRNA(Phe)-imidazoG37] synthetase (radical SAM superfamily)
MPTLEHHIAFGPVPSRRLGQSLGINHIPAKTCSYDCRYCQVGPTTRKSVEPQAFFTPDEVLAAVSTHLQRVRAGGARVDYLSFVPDGEPTLDLRLGDSIDALRPLGVPIAVITNATLLWRPEVRERVARADLVSVKVDAVTEDAWRRVNRPHRGLELDLVLRGIGEFARDFRGTLLSDTMLLDGGNDGEAEVTATAAFLADVGPRTAFLAVPTRPTAAARARGAEPATLARARAIFEARLPRVEVLAGPEPQDFAHTGDARADLLAITAVHPMREAAVRRLLEDNGADWELVERLLAEDALEVLERDGERFYRRRAGP